MDLDEFMATSNRRARRGRRVARALFVEAVLLIGLYGFLLVTAPTTLGGGPSPAVVIVAFAGTAVMLFGLWWMWRILRANPEPDSRSWRYRR